MIPASQNIINAIAGDSRSFKARFLTNLGSETVLAGDLMSLTMHTGGGGETPVPGAIYSSYVEATISGLTQTIYGAELWLQIGVVTSEDPEVVEWLPSNGVYQVTKTEKAGAQTTFTAVGRLTSKCGGEYVSALGYPTNIANVINEIATATGCSISTDINTTGTLESAITGETYANALSIIAGLLGGFVTEAYDGTIKIYGYCSGTGYTIDLNRFMERPAFSETPFSVSGLRCIVQEPTDDDPGVEYSYGTPNVTITNKYMTQALFDAMVQNYVGYTFYPASAPLTLGNPRLEPQDWLIITDTDNTAKSVPCHLITGNFAGGFWQEISSTMGGNDDEDAEQVTGSVTAQLNATVGIAEVARSAAESAIDDAAAAASAAAVADSKAVAAGSAASRAEQNANIARGAASNALAAANDAQASATSAASSASSALTQLSTVEKVVDTLTWISEHATYKASTDTEVVPGKYYFTRSGTAPDYVYSLVTNPTGDPSASGYYEIDTIDEAVSNYIETHLALTNEGLWLIPDDSNGNRVLVSTGAGSGYPAAGTYILGSDGLPLAKFTTGSAVIGKGGAQRLEIYEDGIYGYNADSVSFFAVDYDGAQITANSTVNLSAEESFALHDAGEMRSTLYSGPLGTGLPAGSQLTGSAMRLIVYADTGIFKTSTQPTLTNCTLRSFSGNRLTLDVQLPTITIGTDATFTATAVLQVLPSTTLTVELVIKYTASSGLITAEAVMQKDKYATTDFRYVTLARKAYEWSVTTTAPALLFGTSDGTPGLYSVALGEGLYATQPNQTAIGKYNAEDTETQPELQKAFIIGNGAGPAAADRSNAFSVNNSGDVETAGNVWADGSIEADGDMNCNGNMSPAGDLVAGGNITATGDVEDGAGNVLADMIKGLAGSSGSEGITLGAWKICWGSTSVTTNSASGSGTFAAPYYVDKSITFSFSTTPYVWAIPQASLTGTCFVIVTATSATGATLRLMASAKNTTTRYIRWFAIGKA